MPFSDKQQEFFSRTQATDGISRWVATRSGKTYMDYYVIPKRIRARVERGLGGNPRRF